MEPTANERGSHAENLFVTLSLTGIPTSIAIFRTYESMANDVVASVQSGCDLKQALDAIGVENSDDVVAKLSEWDATSDPHLIADGFFTIVTDGDVKSMPDPKCVRSKLPNGRRPTEDEMRRAFQECLNR